MTSPRDRQGNCGFCEGSGLWADPAGDPSAADPCPLCDGTGGVPQAIVLVDDPAPSTALTVDQVLAALPDLSAAERQRLYEALHALYDCRIYRR